MLVFSIPIAIFTYFFINTIALDENDYEAYVPYIPHIDISLLRTNFDDATLIYIFYYEHNELDIARHHIIDNDGLVSYIDSTTRGSMVISTHAPTFFFTEYGYETRNVYITAVNPRDIFDRILILDPGHGGHDIGAPAVGGIRESDIVLAISLYLYELFQQSNSGIKVYMTRTDDSSVDIAQRVQTANMVGDMLLSVHTNTYPNLTSVAGTETLYSDESAMYRYGNSGRFDMQNSAFSQIVQNHLVAELGTRDRGIVPRTDLHLINASTVPTAYAEIDFKTNPQALANLTNSAYQQRVALALYRGIVEAFAAADS